MNFKLKLIKVCGIRGGLTTLRLKPRCGSSMSSWYCRIAGPYAIESDTLGRAAEERFAVRQDRSWATIDDLEP